MPEAQGASPPLPPARGRLLSDMGMRAGRTSGQQRMHAGMDLGHPGGRGTPILNVQEGVVERVLRDADRRLRAFSGYGNGVIVRHPDDTRALYAHMDRVDAKPSARVRAGQVLGTMGATSNGKFRGMGAHLHLELRRPRPGGQSPFPGPYPRSPQQLYNNLDPRPWLEGRGLVFGSRGAFEIGPGSPMASTRASWEGLGAADPWAGWDGHVQRHLMPLGSDDMDAENDYEPPARFDRDVHFGLTPIEWAAAGAGALVLTGTAVALAVRVSLRRNRRRSRLRSPRRPGGRRPRTSRRSR